MFLPSPLQPPSQSSPPPTLIPSRHSLLSCPLPPYASVILNVGLQLEMRVPASEQWREKNSGTQWDRTRDLYKTKSLRSPNWAIPTDASNGI